MQTQENIQVLLHRYLAQIFSEADKARRKKSLQMERKKQQAPGTEQHPKQTEQVR